MFPQEKSFLPLIFKGLSTSLALDFGQDTLEN